MSWETKILGDICYFENGDRGKNYPSKKHQVDEGIPFINAGDLSPEGRITDTGMAYITDERFELLGAGKIQIDDILFCLRGSLGKCAINKSFHEGAIASSLVILRANKNIVLPEYLLLFLKSDFTTKLIQETAGGAAQPNLSAKVVSKYEVPLPPLPVQKQIVAKLDAAFADIDKAHVATQKNIENAEALFQSSLNKIFQSGGTDWTDILFEDACVLQRGFDLPKKDRNPGSIPLLSANGVTDYIDRWKVKAPGVVTGRSGTIGKVHFIEDDFWALNTALYVKDFKGNYEKFIYYFLSYFDLKSFSSGAGVPTLNRNNVHKEKILFLKSKKEQVFLSNQLDVINAKINQLKPVFTKKLDNLSALKSSILKQAFSGELTKAAA